MRPAIASIPVDGEVQKASNIHNAALLYMFLSTSSGYDSRTLL